MSNAVVVDANAETPISGDEALSTDRVAVGRPGEGVRVFRLGEFLQALLVAGGALPSPQEATELGSLGAYLAIDTETGRFWLVRKSDVEGGGGGSAAWGGITGTMSAQTDLQGALDTLGTQVAGKAPTSSPAFTGVPTAPTAAFGTNTTQVATTAFVQAALVGLLEFKTATDCSSNPNYPSASKGDAYVVSVAGKIGGASGAGVAAGDWYIAVADNAGGTQASVGSSWAVVEHNLPDLGTAATRNVPASGNASSTEVVLGNDTRLSGGSSSQPRPDPALDLAAADPLLATGADLLADDTIAVVTADGTVKRARVDSLLSRDRQLVDDLLDLKPAGLWWGDLTDLYTSVAATTRTATSNSAAFPGQDQGVALVLDRSGNGNHVINSVVGVGTLTVDFTDTGRPAVKTNASNSTLSLSGIAALLPSTGWTVCLMSSKDATAGAFDGSTCSVGKAGTNNYLYLSTRRTDIGSPSGSNVTHRVGDGGGTGLSTPLDDANVADPGVGMAFYAFGHDGTNYWFRKQDGTLATFTAASYSFDQIGFHFTHRSSTTGYVAGHFLPAALFSRSLKPDELARVAAEFKRRTYAPNPLRERATFAARFGGPSGAKLRQVSAPAGALAATVGTVGVGSPNTNNSGPGATVTGGSCLKVGRGDFGRFGGWPARGSWWVAFHGTITTLPGSGDSHLVGQWGVASTNVVYGRVWRLVVTSAGAVRADVTTEPATPTVKTITDSAGLANGNEIRGVLQWDRDAQLLRLNVNARTQVTSSYTGANWSINHGEPFSPVTVGAGWSGSGSDDKDCPLAGTVHSVHAGRGTLSAAELALFLTAGGFETRRLPGPSIRITHRDPHYWWGGSGVKAASPTIELVYTAPDAGGSISYSLDGATPVVGVASPSGRTASFTVSNVPAGRHSLEVWFTNEPGVRDGIRMNVGPVVVVAGQSLAPMASNWPTRFDGPSGYVSIMEPSRRWQRPGTAEITRGYLGALDLSGLSAGYSDWARVAGRTAARLGLPVGVILASQSGTDSLSWAPNATPTLDTTLFGQMLRMVALAGGADLVWWDQGQNDAAFGVSQAQHETRLTAVVDGVWTNLACNTAVVVMPETTASYSASVPAIQAAQAAVITAHARAVPGSNEDGLTPAGDGVHWASSADERTARAEQDARVERHSAALAALGL